MKKTSFVVLLASFAFVFATVGVKAQTSVGGSALTSPAPVGPPVVAGGFVQFNSLTIQSVSATAAPAEIVANGNSIGCLSFESQNAAIGIPTICPSPMAGASGGAGSGSGTGPAHYTLPPTYANSYRIEISATTQIILRDRTQASLSDLAQGDQINVFGFYNADGSVQAYLVRDLSKPAQTETVQLNNVTLVSVSGISLPATLAVTQGTGDPCYGFYGGAATGAVPCPMGISSFSANAATANVTAPAKLAPQWMMLHKYAVNVDARTIILDRNRNQLSLSSLNTGDSLNIYGESSNNGQTIIADIIRDISIPAAASSYTGTVTTVNADGSFVITLSNGTIVTVQNPLTAGQTVTVYGLMNAPSSTISSVTQITIGNSTPPFATPMMGRLPGGTNPSSTGVRPINY